jgi:M6 family metalloprotease-like protein
MNKGSADYHMSRGASFENHRSYIQEAVNLAGTTVDYSKTDAILVIANPAVTVIDFGPGFSPLPGSGILAGGREIDNGATSGSDLIRLGWPWFNHEIGHTMSLIDLAGPLPGNQLWHTYVGDFSVMGNPSGKAPEYFAWERWQLGWLEDNQVICADKTFPQVRLSPIERVGGTKMLVVPTGPNTAVVVESRHAEGYDIAIPKSGPLVYTIDTPLSSHDGAIRIFPVDDTDTHHLQAPMSLGQTMEVGKVSITFISTDTRGDTIKVKEFK